MNHVLTISTEEGKCVLSMHIGACDPLTATPAILAAIAKLPKPRKPRADRGSKRTIVATP